MVLLVRNPLSRSCFLRIQFLDAILEMPKGLRNLVSSPSSYFLALAFSRKKSYGGEVYGNEPSYSHSSRNVCS